MFNLDLADEGGEEDPVLAVQGGGEMDDDAIVNISVPKLTDNSNEDITRLRAEGYGVDVDNEPAQRIHQPRDHPIIEAVLHVRSVIIDRFA